MLKSSRINLILGLGGAFVGVFIVFSKEPVAGAVIAGLLSVVTTIGFFFLEKEKTDSKTRALAQDTSTGVLWFYGTLLLSVLGFLALAQWVLPTELDRRRDALERFLQNSDIQSVVVDTQTLAIPAQAKQAAAALILKSDDLLQTSNTIQLLSTGSTDVPGPTTVYAGDDYCQRLEQLAAAAAAAAGAFTDLADSTPLLEPKTAAQLLQLLDPDKLVAGVDLVRTRYCAPQAGQ